MASASPRSFQLQLIFKPLALVYRIVQLGVGVGNLFPIYKQFKPLHGTRFAAVLFGQRRHLHRVIYDERRLNDVLLHLLAKQLVDEFGLAHGIVYVHTPGAALLPDGGLVHGFYVQARILFDGIRNAQAGVRAGKIQSRSAKSSNGSAVHGYGYLFQQLLKAPHHPVIILVGYVKLNRRKFRVVGTIHALVAE